MYIHLPLVVSLFFVGCTALKLPFGDSYKAQDWTTDIVAKGPWVRVDRADETCAGLYLPVPSTA